LKLTKHFKERWAERVGTPLPTAAEIENMISQAVWLQKGNVYYSARGWIRKVPALYWLPEHDFVLKIDKKESRAITVITSKTRKEQKRC